MVPNFDKVDLPRLISDIPKYDSAGLFPSEIKAWWSSFLADFEATYGTIPASKPAWPLDVFKQIISESLAEPSSVQVPEVISSIHSKQMENRPKVSMHHLEFVYLVVLNFQNFNKNWF